MEGTAAPGEQLSKLSKGAEEGKKERKKEKETSKGRDGRERHGGEPEARCATPLPGAAGRAGRARPQGKGPAGACGGQHTARGKRGGGTKG